jgi:hypothetical protein
VSPQGLNLPLAVPGVVSRHRGCGLFGRLAEERGGRQAGSERMRSAVEYESSTSRLLCSAVLCCALLCSAVLCCALLHRSRVESNRLVGSRPTPLHSTPLLRLTCEHQRITTQPEPKQTSIGKKAPEVPVAHCHSNFICH